MTERTPHRDDRTIDMALGLLTGSEEADAIEAIAPDHSAEEDLIAAVAHRESVRSETPPGMQSAGTHSGTRDNKGGRAKRRSPFPFIGALAAASIAFVLIRMFTPDSFEHPVQPIPVPDEMTRLRGIHDSGEALNAGLNAYEQRSYEDAVRLLADTRADGTTEIVRLVYLASAHNQIGQHGKAIAILEAMPFDMIPDPWGIEALRNLIHALQETSQDARAEEYVERFSFIEETLQ